MSISYTPVGEPRQAPISVSGSDCGEPLKCTQPGIGITIQQALEAIECLVSSVLLSLRDGDHKTCSLLCKSLLKTNLWGWGDAQKLRTLATLGEKSRFSSQHPHGGSQPSWNFSPREPPLTLCTRYAHGVLYM